MSQYNTGTVAVTNGSAVVTGASTLFSANVTAGDFFTVVGDNAFYTVGAVDSDTQLTLSANYAGVTGGARAYTLVGDFTTNLGFPVPNQGDIETALVVKRAIEEIDSELNTAGIGGDGREWIDLKDKPTYVSATQFKIATDKTANYHLNRRIRATDSATLYGAITASSFAAGETTVTVAWDSGGLTASLTAVALGIASATAPSITGDAVVGGTMTGVSSDAPTIGAHVANKTYVDALVVSGVYWKQPVRAATTANITLSGEQTIDGVLTSADRVLVKNQTTGSENGIYVSDAGAWSRATDADSDSEVTAGIAVWVNEGTANGDNGYTLTTDDTITLDTTALTFTQFSGGGGGVSSVSATAPVTSSGGATPDIAIAAATTGAAGSMSAADKSKLDGIESGAEVTDEANVRTALAALTADPSFNSRKITSLADPTSAQDAATKAYVDAQSGGGSVDWKDSVRVATTANITLSSQQTIDGIFVTTGTRVLVKDQTTGSENGIYVSSSSSWSRATDADADAEVTAGLAVTVEEGTVAADTQWLLSTDGAITVGTTALSFTQFTGSGGGVTAVTGAAPITSSGGSTPDIGIAAATTSAAGSMSSADKTKLDGVASSANNYNHPNHTGDVTSVGDGAQTIANNAVTLAKMADMATASLLGRNTVATGDPEVLSKATALSLLNVADGAEVNPAVVSQGDAEAGTATDERIWTAQRVAQSIAALASGADAVARNNIMLNAFRIAINGGLSVLNMQDGIVDEFEDETGVDTAASANQSYDATDDYYETDVSSTPISQGAGSVIGTMPLSGGDAAAFDGTTSQADTAAAASTDNPNFVGKDWGSGNDKFMFDAKVYPSNNSGWTQAAGSGETATIQIRGHSAAPSTGAEGTLLGSDTAAGNSTSSVTITLDNATAWRYVWVYISISGSTDHDCYVAEVEFTETTAVKDMTLVSNAFTAVATPTDARMVMFEQDVDAVTLNTDLKAWASRDDGQTFTTDFGTDEKLDITAHTFANDDRITVSSTTTLPAGLSEGMLYYVVNKTANDFELSLTSGGAAVDITDDGSGTHTAFKWTQITLADEGDYETGRRILAGSADISGQPTGTDMKWILATHNTTEMRIHGVALQWS